ncbi:MAG: hypothetical protein HUN04_02700 [Desulfobacter sp.]|nr:MAG: hypothetical protein HUN04_02700 [Desulfobacter sp.]
MKSINRKPRYYFNSQKTARKTILGLIAGSLFLLFLAITSWQDYNEKGFIRVPQRGIDTYLYGESAKVTINAYVAGSIFLFSIGGYFSVLYIRIWNAQRKHQKKIIPDSCDIDKMEKMICPSCLHSSPIYLTADRTCPKCNTPMDEVNVVIETKAYLEANKNAKDTAIDTEHLYIVLLLFVVMVVLIIWFDPTVNL